jgi:hypothetical protein
MHKNVTKCNKIQSKWCINKHGASKMIDTFEAYHGYILIWFYNFFGAHKYHFWTYLKGDNHNIYQYNSLNDNKYSKACPMALLKNINFATLEKLVVLTSLFGLDATIRQTYVVMCKRRVFCVFCATIFTKSGVSCNFLGCGGFSSLGCGPKLGNHPVKKILVPHLRGRLSAYERGAARNAAWEWRPSSRSEGPRWSRRLWVWLELVRRWRSRFTGGCKGRPRRGI